jgi:hypothetical protein
MHDLGARLMSAHVADVAMDLAQQIHSARDTLRMLYLPGSHAPDRAHRSARAAEGIRNAAQQLEKNLKYLDADITSAKNLNMGQIKKIGQGYGLNIVELTNFAVTMEPDRRFRLS